MNNTPIISPLKVQETNSESISESGRPKAWKSASERNDNPVSRFFALLTNGKKSRKAAIDAMCAHCMGCTAKEQGYRAEDWIEPGFREQIRTCSAPGCPLWEFRPFRGELHD
jgi:hypothetical protein